jgi:hypothetical protein
MRHPFALREPLDTCSHRSLLDISDESAEQPSTAPPAPPAQSAKYPPPSSPCPRYKLTNGPRGKKRPRTRAAPPSRAVRIITEEVDEDEVAEADVWSRRFDN